ncbi:MAG: phosphatase PAP2 family protein [Rhodopseudomonas sp.]|nr:phosphatase PAP2 family protein [Rhodopseudomonas sp.]
MAWVTMRAVYCWLLSLFVTVLLVAICYQWVDRPLALLAHGVASRRHHGLLVWLTYIPNPLPPLAMIVVAGLALQMLFGRAWSRLQTAGFVVSLTVIVVEAVKEQLKFLFGRTWPESWFRNNPSFIRDGTYGFHFMHGGGGYNSFPSGHMASACAVLAVLWFWYPRLRWFYAIAGLAVAVGLVGGNFHFLSDVIAGAFVGGSAGWLAVRLWQAIVPGRYHRA